MRSVGHSRTWLVTVAAMALASVGCAELPAEPTLAGPASVHEASSDGRSNVTQELFWMRGRSWIRITRNDRMCKKDEAESESCVHLSRADRQQLDRFFGNEAFRTRWETYRPCSTLLPTDEKNLFAVTYSDGKIVGRQLDAPFLYQLRRGCDRATHDAIAAIGEDLLNRYAP